MAKKKELPAYEKLGAFFLGKRFDLAQDSLTEDLVLYDSKDLNTHAVIIGMTGSGKTGLGVGLIEEAAIDRVPVIAIDPKGDLANVLLTFPDLKPESFEPWVDPREATRKGQDVSAFAASQAALWKKGLREWGQGPDRIKRLRAAADFQVFTPGSVAATPISALKAFRCPDAGLASEDPDLYRDNVQATATGILALLNMEADPLTSREHILISRILDHTWREGRDLDLAGLIGQIQRPPFESIGVMDLATFYPPKDRMQLAMTLNNLLAAPGFEAWLSGEPLDVARLLNDPASGKPRVSVLSIAHLSDAERMFFVTLLLNEVIRWMRAQPGTGSLRAVLYMDELFGFMPPVANPPSKQLFLTLLKQARAYGLGLVLATQNPVDLDYKGLSNTGTWFIGRLQTERDKARVMEGLEGAAAGGDFDRGHMEAVLAGLGKRRFLLHNVHDDEAVVFNTRWVMSYLAGPLTRDQLKRLAGPAEEEKAPETPASAKPARATENAEAAPPLLPPGVDAHYLPAKSEEPVYVPHMLAAVEWLYESARYDINEEREAIFVAPLTDGVGGVEFDDAQALDVLLDELESEPAPGASFDPLPRAVAAKDVKRWATRFKRWLRTDYPLVLWKSDALKATSRAGESEAEFRARLQLLGNEKRDQAVEKLKARYEKKTKTLNDRLLRAQQAVERESEQAGKRKLDAVVSVGGAILGAVFGRRRSSAVGRAVKGYGSVRKEAGDVDRARERVTALEADLKVLADKFDADVAALDDAYDAQADPLKEVLVKAKSTNIDLRFIGVGLVPDED